MNKPMMTKDFDSKNHNLMSPPKKRSVKQQTKLKGLSPHTKHSLPKSKRVKVVAYDIVGPKDNPAKPNISNNQAKIDNDQYKRDDDIIFTMHYMDK